MTDALKGQTVEQARALFERFHHVVTTPPDQPVEDLGKLSVLAGVREFPGPSEVREPRLAHAQGGARSAKRLDLDRMT